MTGGFRMPRISMRLTKVWMRNFRVWRRLALPSLAGNLLEPMIFLFGLGLGLGKLVGDINGTDYLTFIAPGILCYSVLNTASFEGLYSAFTRMHVQKTWETILNAPMDLDDVFFGEWLWAACKGFLNGMCIFAVLLAFGYVELSVSLLWLPPLLLTLALSSAGIALSVNAIAPNYDFFIFYFTLYVMPMLMLSGAFFPVGVLPEWLEAISGFLPLSRSVASVRPIISGDVADSMFTDTLIIVVLGVIGLFVAHWLTRRRILG